MSGLEKADTMETKDEPGGMMQRVKPLRVVFMGSPDFAIPVLEAVLGLGPEWAVVAAYTSPDRQSGRGRQAHRPPVMRFASDRGIPTLSPSRLSAEGEVERFGALSADLVVLAAYGLLLPVAFLAGPRFGAVNVHPSLLPRHRGAAPVVATILAGDETTGASVIVMDEGLDTGPLLGRREVQLDGTERTPQLTARLFAMGADLLADVLPEYVSGALAPMPQPTEGATVVKRLSKADGQLDWTKPAAVLERQVRAFDPWPGSATSWGGKRLEVLDAAVGEGRRTVPGAVVAIDGSVGVGTAEGVLVLRRVKLEGRRATAAADFVRGHREFLGATLPS